VRAVVGVLARLTAAALARAETAATLRVSCAELRRLCADVLVRQDGELGRTARELHEGICQRLAAANVQLEALAALLEPQGAALARLRDARALVNQTLGELRELAQRLRPSVLENLGYVEALRWYLERLRQRGGVVLSLEVEGGEARLPVAMEGALYRATEEALGPAVRASRRLRVRYRREPTAVRIEIVGPAPDAVDLVAIRERLRPFGGAVHVRSAPDRSAVIAVEVPAPVD
jgi:two-component system, NarL family, sensor histidine kinase UhpB